MKLHDSSGNKLDAYTWIKQMFAKNKPEKLIRKLLLKGMAQEMYLFLKVYTNNLATMTKNPVAKQLRTPKFRSRK